MLGLLLIAFSTHSSEAIAIQNVTIIEPGKTQVRKNCTVLISDGIFTEVGESTNITVPKGSKRIDGKGKFLIPGLWDMHVHWYEESSLGLFTANGVTGVRVMFGQPKHLGWKRGIDNGTMLGPRMKVGSPIVDGKNPMWPDSISLPLNGDAKSLVSRLKNEGWDFIKTYSYLSKEAYINLAQESKNQGIPFAGHVPIGINPQEAANLGQASMEHLDGIWESTWNGEPEYRATINYGMRSEEALSLSIDRASSSLTSEMTAYDPIRAENLYKTLGKSTMWQCPTLVALRALPKMKDPEFIADERLKYMSPEIRKQWDPKNDMRTQSWIKEDWDFWEWMYQKNLSFVRPLKKSGSRFLAGTDCLNPYSFPGFSLHDELALLVEAGLTPTEALEAATVNPARFFGEEKIWGTVSKGKRADAILLDRNPLVDINNTKTIRTVIQNGKVYERAALDKILSSNIHK